MYFINFLSHECVFVCLLDRDRMRKNLLRLCSVLFMLSLRFVNAHAINMSHTHTHILDVRGSKTKVTKDEHVYGISITDIAIVLIELIELHTAVIIALCSF